MAAVAWGMHCSDMPAVLTCSRAPVLQVIVDVLDQCDGNLEEVLEKLTELSVASSVSDLGGALPGFTMCHSYWPVSNVLITWERPAYPRAFTLA